MLVKIATNCRKQGLKQRADERELKEKLKSYEKTKRARKRREKYAQRAARHGDAHKVHGGGGTVGPKKSSGHRRHELKDGLMGLSMNKHSTGNSDPNVLSSSDSNNRRGNNSGSGEQGNRNPVCFNDVIPL